MRRRKGGRRGGEDSAEAEAEAAEGEGKGKGSDDYDAFLVQLMQTVRSGVQPWPLSGLLLQTTVVTLQGTIVTLFLTVFKYLMHGLLNPMHLLIVDSVVLIAGYLLHRACKPPRDAQYGLDALVSVTFLFSVCIRLFSPILQTLTVSCSDDTLHALIIAFSVCHLAFYDYKTTRHSGTVSFNCIFFVTVLLASRMTSNTSVFSFIVLGTELFMFFPYVGKAIQARSTFAHVLLTALLVATACLLLALLDKTLLVSYTVLVCLINVVCPVWLYKMQSVRVELSGPWDIAQV